MEIKLGISEIEFDDTVYQLAPLLGLETKIKKFVNVMSHRIIPSDRRFYSYEDSKPLFIFTMGLYKEGKMYERYEYGILDCLGAIGGLVDALTVGFLLVVAFLSGIDIDLQMFKYFSFLISDEPEAFDD